MYFLQLVILSSYHMQVWDQGKRVLHDRRKPQGKTACKGCENREQTVAGGIQVCAFSRPWTLKCVCVCEALVATFGWLIFGCIEADFLQVDTHFAVFY